MPMHGPRLKPASILCSQACGHKAVSYTHLDVYKRQYLRMANKEGAGSEAFEQSQQLIDETIGKIRSLSHRLQPAMLQRLGLQMALQSFFDVFNKSGVIQIDFSGDELPPLDENKSLALYRICLLYTSRCV